MASSNIPHNGAYIRDFSWIDCILHISDPENINIEKLQKLHDQFAGLTILSAGKNPGHLQQSIAWHPYDSEVTGKADAWNTLLKESKREWVLFLEQGEEVRFYLLPDQDELDPKTWVPACISQKDVKSEKNVYQVRLVHSGADSPFSGWHLPDSTLYIMENEIHLFDRPLILERYGDGLRSIDPLEEMSVKNVSPKVYLLEGERLMEKRNYVQASAQYRTVLKIEKLLPFDRLSAVNGLARCYTEQFKWPKALQLAEKSISAEPAQRIPYLIQFRIHQLNKQWGEAYNVLKEYSKHIETTTRSSFDIAISETEMLNHLGELAMKAGFKEDAFGYFEEIYSDSRGEVDTDVLRRLLMLSIELEKRERAIFYFEAMYKCNFPGELSRRQTAELNDYMSLFMNNGWYQYASEIYEELYDVYSDNPEYRRRLIVTFTKTDRIDRARKLIAS